MAPYRLLTPVALVILLHVTSVRADFLNWTYSTTPSVPGVSAGSSAGTVQLTDYTKQAGGMHIPVIAYTTASASTSPVTFDPSNSTYTMKMTITDNATHDTGTLTFTGSIGGKLTATTSTLTNAFAPSPNSLTLDEHVYTVVIPTAHLALPTSPQQNIMATVSVRNVNGGGTPPPQSPSPHPPHPLTSPPDTNTPEPSSIVLAGAASPSWERRGCGVYAYV